MENFDKPPQAPAPRNLSKFDWVSEKASELKTVARQYFGDKSDRQIAIEGAILAAGLTASALLHINLTKSGKLLEGMIARKTETTAIGAEFEALAEKGTGQQAVFAPVACSFSETIVEGGFTLPRRMSARTVARTPQNWIHTRILPCPDEREYDRMVAHRFDLRIDLAEDNSIGIMHPRFRNGAKLMMLLKDPDRNLSLYGNNENGVGVLEYVNLPSTRRYFKHADSVVQIKFSGGSRGVGSGTIISEDGLIATAAHVVPPDRKIMVDTIRGQFEAKVVVRELTDHLDRAAIQLIGVPKDITFPVPTMTSVELKGRMRAATVGHPQGLSGRFASVGQYYNDVDFDMEEIRGFHPTFLLDSVMPGHSGGPIFDSNGNFAVILTKRFLANKDGPFGHLNRGMAMGDRIEDLLDLLKKQRQV